MAAKSEKITLELAGRELSISSPNKEFFSKRGETKLDLINFYRSVEEPLMKAIGGRPILMQRFPDGASGKSFFQKRVPKGAPDWLQTAVVATPNGTTSNAMVAADIAHIAWAVNLGCLGFHGWPHTAAEPHITDELRVDLDPSKGITLDDIKVVAFQVRDILAEVGIDVYPKTSGSRGLHLFAHLEPRWDSYAVRAAAVLKMNGSHLVNMVNMMIWSNT